MNPVAFTLFGLEVRWYGIFIACGALLAIFFAEKLIERNDILGDLVRLAHCSPTEADDTSTYIIYREDNPLMIAISTRAPLVRSVEQARRHKALHIVAMLLDILHQSTSITR